MLWLLVDCLLWCELVLFTSIRVACCGVFKDFGFVNLSVVLVGYVGACMMGAMLVCWGNVFCDLLCVDLLL